MMNRQTHIEKILTENLSPSYLEVINESHNHSVPVNSETHFKIILVSDKFFGQKLVGRHRIVNNLLLEELKNGLHALSLHLFTKDEWREKQSVSESPECMGGSKIDKK